jgi:DNA repair exonuclease SbcCD ATPase subunit
VEDLVVPPDLIARRQGLQGRIDALNREIPALTRRLNELRNKEEQVRELSVQVNALPGLYTEIEHLQDKLKHLETAGKQGQLYNQVLDVGRQYLEQVQPKHCPVCKQAIKDLDDLLNTLRSETPADVEKMRQEYKALSQQLTTKESQASALESQQKQLVGLEDELVKFPTDLEQQIAQKQQDS